MGLGGTFRLVGGGVSGREDFKVIMWGASHKEL